MAFSAFGSSAAEVTFETAQGLKASFRLEMLEGVPGRLVLRVTRDAGRMHDETAHPARLLLSPEGALDAQERAGSAGGGRALRAGTIPASARAQVVPALAALARRATPAVLLEGAFPPAAAAPPLPPPPAAHVGVSCNGCGASPLRGVRFRCAVCDSVDLCAACFERAAYTGGGHAPLAHAMLALPQPAQRLANERLSTPCTTPGCANTSGPKYKCAEAACAAAGVWCEACELTRAHDASHAREKRFPGAEAPFPAPAPIEGAAPPAAPRAAAGGGGGGGGGGDRFMYPMHVPPVSRGWDSIAALQHQSFGMPHRTSGFFGRS